MEKSQLNCGSAKWIWSDDCNPNTYCCARGSFSILTDPICGILNIIADSRYNVWVNGQYVGQGPTPFKPPYLFFDSYDVTAYLQKGHNVIAILGNYHGVRHCTYTPGIPGILANLKVETVDGAFMEAATDFSWKVHVLDAYKRDVPRRTWATSWAEYYDARLEPCGWQEPSFNDSSWSNAKEREVGEVKLFPRITPLLEELSVNCKNVIGMWKVAAGIPLECMSDEKQSAGLTEWLDKEYLEKNYTIAGKRIKDHFFGAPLIIEANEFGIAFTMDLEKEITGQIEIELEAPEGVTIDLCPTEILDIDRPWCYRKRGEYARRYITRSGRQKWRCFGYDAIKYIHVVVRGPHPKLVFHRVGALQRQIDLPIQATFKSNDKIIDRIWEISCQTMRVCTQEIHIDCASREQTSAWGDHIWSGLWAGYMTGNFSALKHLVISMEHSQMKDGQMPCYPFASDHNISPVHEQLPLYDYSLIAVWGLWIYYRATGDKVLTKNIIQVCERVLSWYKNQIGLTGLIEMDCDMLWKQKIGQLFIDHPGLGSHNSPYPGLDRRGINAALNFFYIIALESHANVLESMEQDKRAKAFRKEASLMKIAAQHYFYNESKGAYADGYFEKKQLDQISQQTNALAVISGVCPQSRAKKLLLRILDPDDLSLCRCGSYFWLYLAEALCMSEMHDIMFKEVVVLWNEMAEKGATTWWETFLGDELDSLCHMWSSVPSYLLLSEILGVKPKEAGFTKIDIKPRIDILKNVSGSIHLPNGTVSISWDCISEDEYKLTIILKGEMSGMLTLPKNYKVKGCNDISIRLNANNTAEFEIIISK